MKNKRTINIKSGNTESNTFKKTVNVTNTYENINPRLKYPKGNTGPECKQCNKENEDTILIDTQIYKKTIWDISLNKGCGLISKHVKFNDTYINPNGFIIDYVTGESIGDKIKVLFTIVIINKEPMDDTLYIIDNPVIKVDITKIYNLTTHTSFTKTGAPFRAPIAGYRRSLICDNPCNIPTNTVYGDSLYMTLQNVCYDKQIRSGMQANKNDSCKNNTSEKAYSFSYAEYNKNRSLNTYERGLEHNKQSDGKYLKSSGYACDESSCNTNNITVWKPNNEPFKVQGAVSSSSRIDRLKLETLRVANSKCNNPCDNNNVGKGKYFAGKPRFDGWMFNRNHREIVKKTIYK